MAYYIGIDIGGTNVRAIFVSESAILLKLVAYTKKSGPPDTLVNQVITLIEEGIKHLQIPLEEVVGIGTSSAGPFVDHGTRLWTPNISGVGNDWRDIPYLQPLMTHFGDNVVYALANDCVSSVKAEQLFGAGAGFSNLVYVTISTGVGGGIIVNGHLLEGKSKNAGHFGHIIVQKDGPLCGCGQHGCIEALASGRSLARRAQEMGIQLPEGKEITAKDVFDLYRQGEPKAQQLIHQTIEYLGVAFCSLINLADPEIIILGGGVFLYNQDVLLKPLQKYVAENSYQAISTGVQFVPTGLGDFVGDLAGLSLILPDNVITAWQQNKPWEKKDFPIITI